MECSSKRRDCQEGRDRERKENNKQKNKGGTMHTEPLASFAVAEHAEKPRARSTEDRNAEGRATLFATSAGMARLEWIRIGDIARC